MRIKILSIGFCFNVFFMLGQTPFVSTPTIIPQNPTGASNIKIITKVTTPNQSIIVDLNSFTVTSQQIKIRGCYWQGMLPATQSYIDTLNIGQLPLGNYQIIQKAYLSTTQQHCSPIDSNSIVLAFNVTSGTFSTTSINEAVIDKKVYVYPNPSAECLFIYGISDEAEASVFSIDGALIKKELFSNRSLNIHYLADGMYFIRISDRGKSYTEKFLKSGAGHN